MIQLPSFLDLAQRVRTHVCYAHVFGDALDTAQLVGRCAPQDPEGVARELALLEASGEVEQLGGLWFLPGEGVPDLREVKRRGEASAERILEEHRALLGVLRRLPIVRLLAVSGSVAWRNHGRSNGRKPDLDLFVITAPGAVHVVRFLLRAWGLLERCATHLGLRRPRAKVCPNYLTDGRFLDVTNKSFYTASDAVHVRVLKGQAEYSRFVIANPWIGHYYPFVVQRGARGNRPWTNPVLWALNLACFGALAACSWVKLRLGARRNGSSPSHEFAYSIAFRADVNNSLVRSAPAGGGHQPEVACRFDRVYARHFGRDERLQAFLFPDTTSTGIETPAGHARSGIVTPLGYHE